MNGSKKPSSREIERKFLLKQFPPGLKKFHHDIIEQGYRGWARRPSGSSAQEGSSARLLSSKGQRRTGGREIRLSVEQFSARPATVGRRLTKVATMPWKTHTIGSIFIGAGTTVWLWPSGFDDQKSCAAFEPPDWIGRDVTGKPKYSNVALALH
jgi:hypothetical protein